MRRVLALLALAAATASAQDTSFAHLRLRAGALRLPAVGHIGDDWRAGTGFQLAVGSNVGRGELALGVARIAFDPITAKPSFTQTRFSLGWTIPVLEGARAALELGPRLADVRMDFDDPSLVGGLRTEEEVELGAVARGRVRLGGGFDAFAEASYGVQMLSTRTPVAGIAAGLQHGAPMPGWLRGILR